MWCKSELKLQWFDKLLMTVVGMGAVSRCCHLAGDISTRPESKTEALRCAYSDLWLDEHGFDLRFSVSPECLD